MVNTQSKILFFRTRSSLEQSVYKYLSRKAVPLWVLCFCSRFIMKVNPINVIRLLMATFEVFNLAETPVNNEERELADNFQKILIQSMEEYNGVEMIEETSLDFEEPYKDIEITAIEDQLFQPHPKESSDSCSEDDEPIDFDYKKRAVEFWRSAKTKENLSIKTVSHRIKKVKSSRQLRRWAHQINKGGTYMEKLKRISEYTIHNMKNAIDGGMIIHDIDLRRWALQAKKEITKNYRKSTDSTKTIRRISAESSALFCYVWPRKYL